MKYIIFAIDTNIQEFLFIIEYSKGDKSNMIVLGELIKLNNFCHLKNFGFDFFEIVEDPNYYFNKEGIYIYKYNTFTDVLNRMDIHLTSEEKEYLRLKNKEVFSIMTKKTKSEILYIINNPDGPNYELFKKMFDN